MASRTLAQVYEQVAEDAVSPLSGRVARAVAGSEAALRALETLPARHRKPPLVLAALYYLALAGRAPSLAAAYTAGDGDAASRAAVETLLTMTAEIAAVATRRPVRAAETARCAVLLPALAEVAHRAGARTVGLIDVGGGLNPLSDRVGVTYDNGQVLGDASSPVQLTASVVGAGPLPDRALPEVVARIGVGPDPVDLTDPDETRWLHACLGPDRPDEARRLRAQTGLAAANPAVFLRGNPVERLSDAVALIPAGALPVITTTWALSRLTPANRLRFRDRLAELAGGRTLAWVSAEGVGVAPAIPTLGDRPASGHSIIGLALFEGPNLRAEAVGRCWSRGRMLSWR